MTQNIRRLVLIAAALCFAAPSCAHEAKDGEAAAVANGEALAEAHCAQCHATGPTGASPYPAAPVWREWVANNDVDDLARRFAEGKMIHRDGERSMPEFTLSSEEIGDLLTYMKSLRVS